MPIYPIINEYLPFSINNLLRLLSTLITSTNMLYCMIMYHYYIVHAVVLSAFSPTESTESALQTNVFFSRDSCFNLKRARYSKEKLIKVSVWIWSNVSDQNSCSQQPPGSKSEKDLNTKSRRTKDSILKTKQNFGFTIWIFTFGGKTTLFLTVRNRFWIDVKVSKGKHESSNEASVELQIDCNHALFR